MSRQEIKRTVRNRLFQQFNAESISGANRGALEREVLEALKRLRVDRRERAGLAAELMEDLLGYGPLGPLLEDPEITEIMVNGPRVVYVERGGLYQETPVRFDDEEHLRAVLSKMARQTARRVDESSPYVDLTLPDGTRVNAVLPPVAVGGTLLTLRKLRRDWGGLEALVDLGSLDVPMSRLLWACVQARLNILFSGGTGAGKTTLLEILSAYIDESERIVMLEDTPELRLRQRHVARMQTRAANVEGKGAVSLRALMRNALRMSPSRIILGEIRGPEAFEFLQALSSGHRGCLAVTHASSTPEAILRVENLVALAGLNLPGAVVRSQIAHALDVVVQMDRMRDGSRKISAIGEVDTQLGPDGMVQIHDLFRWQETGAQADGRIRGRFVPQGRVPDFFKQIQALGLSIDVAIFGHPRR